MGKIKTLIKYSAMLLMGALGRFPVSWLLSKKEGEALRWKKAAANNWVKCPSGNVFYIEYDGPVHAQPIVFVHGLNATRKQWYYQRKYFKQKYRLVFIDLPGHGGSPKSSDLSMQTLAADLGSVLNFLNVKNPVIYGHSWGSSILMQYCLLAGNNINAKGVILHGGSYTNPLKAVQFPLLAQALEKPFIVPVLKLASKTGPFWDVLSRINFYNGFTTLISRFVLFAGGQTAAQLRYIAGLAPDCTTRSVTKGLMELFKLDLTSQLSNIKVPALVVGGLYDRLHQLDCSRYIHEQIAGSQFVVMDGGHQSMVENCDKLNNTIDTFIQQLA